MSDFSDKIRLKGKVEEDLFFAKINKALIEKIHQSQHRHSEPVDINTEPHLIPEKHKH